MKLAYFGSDPFAVAPLEALIADGHEVALVVTNPDRPRGRSGDPQPTPVKEVALRIGAPLLQPEGKLGAPEAERVRASGAELGVVVAFGSFLVKAVREAPSLGYSINVHGSVLPRWRGAAPDAAAILHGDRETGVTIQRVEKVLDGGPVLLARTTAIGDDETKGALRERLSVMGAELVVEAVRRIAAGTAVFTPQDEAGVTHAPTLVKDDGRLDWTRPAVELARRVRACSPWPSGWVPLAEGPLQVVRARACPGAGAPGELLAITKGPSGGEGDGGVSVATGDGALELVTVKPAGKREMAGAAWARGRRLAPGATLA